MTVKMATVDVKLSRFERHPWGFRLHGGADFGSPLIIQKVNKGTFQALFIPGDITPGVKTQMMTIIRLSPAWPVMERAGSVDKLKGPTVRVPFS